METSTCKHVAVIIILEWSNQSMKMVQSQTLLTLLNLVVYKHHVSLSIVVSLIIEYLAEQCSVIIVAHVMREQ